MSNAVNPSVRSVDVSVTLNLVAMVAKLYLSAPDQLFPKRCSNWVPISTSNMDSIFNWMVFEGLEVIPLLSCVIALMEFRPTSPLLLLSNDQLPSTSL